MHAGRTGRGRQPQADMDAQLVLRLLDELTARDLPAWIHGGWGVDALLERQTRPHDDLDLIVRLDDLERIVRVLRDLDYVFTSCERPGIVEYLVDAAGHQVDVHPVVFAPSGEAVYTMANGEDWIYPAGAFGSGRILDREVPCLTAASMLVDHTTGYALDEVHQRDAIALGRRFGIPLPDFDTASSS